MARHIHLRAATPFVVVVALSASGACAVGGPGAEPLLRSNQESVAYCALAPVARAEVLQSRKNLSDVVDDLERRGVLVDEWGIETGRLVVILDRHTAPGSVDILKSVIGSAGLCIIEGGEISVAA